MVQEIKCYRDSSGKIHESACAAHRAELVLWLMQTGTINDASANALAERMINESRELKAMIEAVDEHCPRATAELVDRDGLVIAA